MASLAGKLAGALAGGGLSGTTPATFADFVTTLRDELNAVEADSARHLWVPEPSTVTLNAGNLSQINESWGGARHLIQATAANQPAWVTSGGPNNRPYINLQDTGRFMLATALPSIPDANRVGMYMVGAVAGSSGVQRVLAESLNAANGAVQSFQENTSNRFAFQGTIFTGGAQTLSITSPARDTAWHLFAIRPLDTGALGQIDGATVTPNYAGSDTLDDQTQMRVGRNTVSAGRVALVMLVHNPTAAKDAIIRRRLRQRFRLAT